MKKYYAFILCSLLLCGCSESEYVHSSEPRSQIYYGQPVSDVYENFGTPTKGVWISSNERVLIWISQEIEKDWAYRYLRACTIKIHLKNERVINWSAQGQGCVISSNSKGEEVEKLVEGKTSNQPKMYAVPTDAFGNNISSAYSVSTTRTTSSPTTSTLTPNGYIIPEDAFNSGLFSGNSAATFVPITPQSTLTEPVQQKELPQESSWFSTDDSDDEWGLFDS